MSAFVQEMDPPSSTGRHAGDGVVRKTPDYARRQLSERPGRNSAEKGFGVSGGGEVKRIFSQNRSALSFSEEKQIAEFDPSTYSATQSLASVLNNPKLGKAGIYSSDASWGSWFFQSGSDPLFDTAPPPLPAGTLPEISRADFQPYLDTICESYNRFVDVRDHLSREQNDLVSGERRGGESGDGEGRQQGEGLTACLREIPSLYFDEDFALENGSTFQAACPFSTIPQNMMLQEKLTSYLDLVEVHLVREIAARSDSFFDAQGQLEGLNGTIVQTCEQIRCLQETVQLLDGDVVDCARRIQMLKSRRDNLLALHHKLKLIGYVSQALSALRLLVVAADCGGALDVIDNLQQLQEGDELVGLHCFRHLGEQLASAMDDVNSMLAADFVRAAIHDTVDIEPSAIVSNYNDRQKLNFSSAKEVMLFQAKVDEDEESGIREQLLPLVIGLLRTSKLPAVLRIYRDTLITDIKAAIKSVVAELLPLLFTRFPESDLPCADRQTDLDVGGLSLAHKLRGLSPDNFLQLLMAVFATVQARLVRAAEVRAVIEQIVGGLQGSYAAAAVAAAFASGAAAAAAAESAEEVRQNMLHANSGALSRESDYSTSTSLSKGNSSIVSKQFRADVLRENTEAVCAACDAAHQRWAKLLGVRALIHPKLRLQEFVSIHSTTQEFISATEKVGGRLGYSIRGTLQSQSKSFVDSQHSSRMSKLTAVLEQETWVAIDVPDEFQFIVDSLTTQTFDSGGHDVAAVLHSRTASETVVASDNQVNGNLLRGGSDDLEHSVEPAGHGTQSPERAPGAGALETGGVNGAEPKHSPQTHPVSADAATVAAAPARLKKGREKPSVKTLHIRGASYHAVNSALILLKMISEYLDMTNALPTLVTEVVHRVAEILKLFNSRTCQLVLGAGAMQVSGLKSITAKHLALASQSISIFFAVIPDIRRLLSFHIPDVRKALLLTELDRIVQDYRVHRDEIHTKLVQIMKERLAAHLRNIPQTVENWNKADDSDTQPSPVARALTKEVGVLHRVLSPILLEADVKSIFTRVVALFHSQLADSFSKVEVTTSQAKQRLYRDVQLILACMHTLPSDGKKGELDDFLAQKFGNEPPS